MKKTLSRYGNSLALIIDKPILELLSIKEDTILIIKTDGQQLIITPELKADDEKNKEASALNREENFRKIVEYVMKEFEEDFKKLADN